MADDKAYGWDEDLGNPVGWSPAGFEYLYQGQVVRATAEMKAAARARAAAAANAVQTGVTSNPYAGPQLPPSDNPLLNVFGEHPVALLAGAGALLGVAGAAAAYGLSSDGPKRRAKRKSSKKASKGRAYESASGITGSERQYKRKGGGRVKYTKKGQPYVLDKSGKARFIKKSKR